MTPTFNVVFVAGSAARLLPFTLSLMQGSPTCRYRLVDNGGRVADANLLQAAADRFEQLDYFRTPGVAPIEHGAALNSVFEAFAEPYFAMIDSDVCASGDFLPGLLPLPDGCAATFSASPVWTEDSDTVAAVGCTWIGARQRTLHSGIPIGNTYCGIYDRTALEGVWSGSPRGFAVQDRYMLSPEVRALLSRSGWRFTTFDTSRLLNLLLLASGHRLENRQIAELHHVGGLSAVGRARSPETVPTLFKRLVEILGSSDSGRGLRIWDGLRHRVYMWRSRRQPEHRAMNHRRAVVTQYLDSVMSAASEGQASPTAPRTLSAEVDSKLAVLADTLQQMYGANLEICRSLTESKPSS